MAITGTLEADFSSFDAAVKSSEAKLQAFEGSSNKVAAALTQLTDATPPRLVQLGASVGDVGAGADRALGPVNSLRDVMGSFDATLSSMGVNIGPAARGLAEIGDASGKSAGELGLLGTAGLAAGAAMAGWGVGRAVSEFLGLDAAIGNATAKLLGWRTGAEEAGAAQDAINLASQRAGRQILSHTMALEINTEWVKKHADAATTANDAIERLDAPKKMADQLAAWTAEIETVRSSGVLSDLTADMKSQNFTLEALSKTYHISVPALQEYSREMKAGGDALQEMGKKLASLRKDADDSAKTLAGAAKKLADEAAAANAKWAAGMAELTAAGKGVQGIVDGINGSVVEGIKFYLDAGVSVQTLAKMFGLEEIEIRAVATAHREEIAAKKASTEATNENAAATTTIIAEKKKEIEMVHTLAGAYISLADAQRLHDMGGSATIPTLTPAQVERMGGRAEIERQVALGRPQNPGTNTAEGYADLARRQAAFEAMVRYLATVGPAAQQVTTSFATLSSTLATVTGGGGGGGAGGRHGSVPVDPYAVGQPMQETDRLLYTLIDGIKTSPPTVNVSINVSGVLDPRTRTELTEAVSEEIMRNLRLGRQING